MNLKVRTKVRSRANNMLTKKQQEFLEQEDNRITLLYGSVRSGKTYISLLKYALTINKYPLNAQHIMVGKTLTSLKRNCLSLMEELIGSECIKYSLSQKKYAKYCSGKKSLIEFLKFSSY